MSSRHGMRVVRTLAVAMLACSHVPAVAAAGGVDGTWWRSKTSQEHTGYLAGYIDCALYDAGRKELANARWNVLERKVTEYYQSDPARLGKPVSTVLMELGRLERPNPRDSSGETYPGKHGMFDGEYWRQSLPEHRLGFIQGYLECWRNERRPGATYSKGSEWYVGQVSSWFGVKEEDPSEIQPDRSETKIADALARFRD